MIMNALRATAIAIVGLGMAAPASAGQVENARRLFFDQISGVVEDTEAYIEGGDRSDAERTIAELHELTQQMQDVMYPLEQSARSFSTWLGDSWAVTLREVDGFNASVAALKMVAANQQVGLDAVGSEFDKVQSAFDRVEAELERSTDNSEYFHQQFVQFCDDCD